MKVIGGREMKSQFWKCSVLEMYVRQAGGDVNKIIKYKNMKFMGKRVKIRESLEIDGI